MFNANSERLRPHCPAIVKFHEENGGLLPEHVAEIARKVPNFLLLIRCNNGRFLTPAQNVKHYLALIERDFKVLEAVHGDTVAAMQHGGDYVRDVSIPMPQTPA
jgi:hypothetical protein